MDLFLIYKSGIEFADGHRDFVNISIIVSSSSDQDSGPTLTFYYFPRNWLTARSPSDSRLSCYLVQSLSELGNGRVKDSRQVRTPLSSSLGLRSNLGSLLGQKSCLTSLLIPQGQYA